VPVDGGPAVPLPVPAQYDVVQWSKDSRSLYICRSGEVPLRIYQLGLSTGEQTFVRELAPPDRAGVIKVAPVVSTLDASAFAYSYYQTLSVLYVISGLR